jgi:hypothetical protein
MKKQDLEERLIDFAATIILFANSIDKSYAGNHLTGQIVRSSSSPALNYGEAQSGESKKDFIERAELSSKKELINKLKSEANELISIFVSSIKTAKANSEIKNR